MTVKITVPIQCTPPFPNISARRAQFTLEARGFPACETSPVLLTPRGMFMTATLTPQAAADEARGTYREVTESSAPSVSTRHSGGRAGPCREHRSADPRGV